MEAFDYVISAVDAIELHYILSNSKGYIDIPGIDSILASLDSV